MIMIMIHIIPCVCLQDFEVGYSYINIVIISSSSSRSSSSNIVVNIVMMPFSMSIIISRTLKSATPSARRAPSCGCRPAHVLVLVIDILCLGLLCSLLLLLHD